MPYQTIDQFNATGVDGILAYSAQIVPSFVPMVLLGVFIVTSFASYFAQIRTVGKGDFWASLSVGGIAQFMIALAMTLGEQTIINSYTLVLSFVIMFGITVIFFNTKEPEL